MSEVRVDDHGGVGDGTTIDSDAVQAAVNAAGEGGTIKFTGGKTYVIDTRIFLQAYQKVDYNGATIKRAPQAKATLTAAFNDDSSGDVTLQVDDASGFRVGSYLTVVLPTRRQRTVAEETSTGLGAGQVTPNEDAENPYAADVVQHRIVGITATSITVTGNFFSANFSSRTGVVEFPIGAEVLTAFTMWMMNSDDPGCEIFGGVHDGSTEAHDLDASGSTAGGYQVRGRRWETTDEMRCFGDSCYFHDLEFVNLPSDGIIVGGNGTVVERCKFTNVGGNPTHFSGGNTGGGDDCRIDLCHVYGANRVWIEHDGLTAADAASAGAVVRGTVGHENGAYAWSLWCERVHLTNCYAEDAMCLFSPLYDPLNDEATISLCTGRNLIFGFFLYSAGSTQGKDVILDRVRLYDCGLCRIGRLTANAPYQQGQIRTTLLGCELVNTKIALHYAHDFKMIGGRIRHDAPAATGSAVVTIIGGSNIEIRTHVDGANSGLYASGAVDGLTIASRWSRIHSYAINLSDLDVASRRVYVMGNEAKFGEYLATDDATSTTAPAAGVNFLRAGTGGGGAIIIAECNHVRMEAAGIVFYIHGGEVKIRNNTIETNPATFTRPVRFYAGTSAAFVDNWITYDPKDDPGRGASAGAAISQAGGTPGNGTVVSLSADALALTGTYWIFINSASTNAGRFVVFRPDGVLDGAGVVGLAYNGMINFTLSDGSTDFTIGDRIPITVTGNAIERNRTMTWAA